MQPRPEAPPVRRFWTLGHLSSGAGRSAVFSTATLADVLWRAGANVLFLFGAVSGTAALLLMLGGKLGRLEASAVLIAAVGVSAIVPYASDRARWGLTWTSTLFIAVVSIAMSLAIYDTSIDGQNYHFQAIDALTHGWNPYWSADVPSALGLPAERWVLHYPKAAWLFDATLVAAGFPLEATKAINILALLASALILAGALAQLSLSWPKIVALTLVASFNPVTLAQLFTRMNDGLLASCMLIFAVSAVVWIARDDRRAYFVAATSMIFAVNLKFSAVPVFALFCAALVTGAFVRNGWRSALSISWHLLAAGLIGILVFGWSPYVLNHLHFGHPFYPLMGAGNADIMSYNTPDALVGRSMAERLLFSLFAATHSGYGAGPVLKLPLMISPAELRAAGVSPDPRIGGFGPLFSAAIVAAVAAMILLLTTSKRTVQLRWFLAVGATLILSVIVMPENWWARYVPQLWLVPALVALLALAVPQRWVQISGWAVVVLMLANSLLVAASTTAFALKRSADVTAQLAALKSEPRPYCAAAELALSRLAIMQEQGIDVRLIPAMSSLQCPSPRKFAGYGPDRSGGKICPCAAQ